MRRDVAYGQVWQFYDEGVVCVALCRVSTGRYIQWLCVPLSDGRDHRLLDRQRPTIIYDIEHQDGWRRLE